MSRLGQRLIWAAVAAVVLALLMAQAAGKPLIADEIEFVQTAPAVWRGEVPRACDGQRMEPIVHHPQAYHLLLGASLGLGPSPLLAARLPGIISLLLCFPLLGWLARQLAGAGSPGVERFAVVLLACAPLAVQGALLVDIDNTILVPVFLLFTNLLYGRIRDRQRSRRQLAGLALVFAGLLWIKLPTPLVGLGALALTGLLAKGRRYLVADALVIGLAGGALFGLTWYGFCRHWGLDWAAPLMHLAGRLQRTALEPLPLRLGKDALRLLLWLGPWLPVAAAAAVPRILARQGGCRPPTLFVLLTTGLLMVGYLLVGGNAFGFPRYHAPVVPLLAALAAAWWPDLRSRARRAAVMAVCVFGLLAFLAPDVLEPVYTLSESIRSGDSTPTAGRIRALAVLLLWTAPGLVLVLRPGAAGLGTGGGAAMLAVAAGLALVAHQFTAAYNTHYLYGERGFNDAAGRLAALGETTLPVLAPKDLAYPVLPCGRYLFLARTVSRGRLPGLLAGQRLAAVVYRRGHLADASVAPFLTDAGVGKILERDFDASRTGDFFVYVKKEPQGGLAHSTPP